MRYDVTDDSGASVSFGESSFRKHFSRTDTPDDRRPDGKKNYGSFRFEARILVSNLIKSGASARFIAEESDLAALVRRETENSPVRVDLCSSGDGDPRQRVVATCTVSPSLAKQLGDLHVGGKLFVPGSKPWTVRREEGAYIFDGPGAHGRVSERVLKPFLY